jgi:predicted dehydrogenase
MKPLRLGLIGVGKHGSRYAKHIVEDIPHAELVALCRRNRQEGELLAATHGCSFYTDYHQLLADPRVDAVVVAVPPALHGEIVAEACQVGKHLLIEKPLAVNVSEARNIRDRVAASGVRCTVAHTLRFNTVVQTLKSHIPLIAPLHTIYLSQRFEPSPLAWLDRKAESGGGIILHTGVHSFDLLRFLSGHEVQEVWCQTTTVFTKETEDNFLMQCRLDDPLLKGAAAGSRSTASRSGLIEISGEKGQLLGDHAHGFAYFISGLERTPLALEPLRPTVRETLTAFVEGVQQGTTFPITVKDGLRAVAIAEACYQSATSGKAATVDLSL